MIGIIILRSSSTTISVNCERNSKTASTEDIVPRGDMTAISQCSNLFSAFNISLKI